MTWIKMRADLYTDPAVIQMAAELDLDEDTIVGKLHRLWSWADQQTTDGNATGVTRKWIDRFLACPGFADAMIAAGWLYSDDSGISFPNFEVHNGETAKRRALTARRAAKSRGNVTQECAKRNATTVTKSAPREEKEKDKNKSSSSSASLNGAPPDGPQARMTMMISELEGEGVIAAEQAVRTAVERGVGLDDIQAILDFYRRHTDHYGPKQLQMRVKSARPGQDWSKLWVPLEESERKRRSRSRVNATVDTAGREYDQRKAECESERAEKSRLEGSHGAELDRLRDHEPERFADLEVSALNETELRFCRQQKRHGFHERLKLLRALAAT